MSDSDTGAYDDGGVDAAGSDAGHESDEEDSCEDPLASLARWCRMQLRNGDDLPAVSACREALAAAGVPPCPQRLLLHLGATVTGNRFLAGLADRLRFELDALSGATATPARERSRRHQARGRIFEQLGRYGEADDELCRGLAAEGVMLGAMSEEGIGSDGGTTGATFDACGRLSPLREADLRAAVGSCSSGAARSLLYSLIRLRRQRRVGAQCTRPKPQGTVPAAAHVCPRPVTRAPAGLTAAELERDYAATGIPVVLPLPAGTGPPTGERWWSLDVLRQRLGSCRAELKRMVPGSVAWASLEAAAPSSSSSSPLSQTLGDFIDDVRRREAAAAPNVASTDAAPTGAVAAGAVAAGAVAAGASLPDEQYLFDWSIPQHCPSLLDEFVVPSPFSGDLLQHTPPGSLLREAWPSLFIGPRGSRCGVHVDAYGAWSSLATFPPFRVLCSHPATRLGGASCLHPCIPIFGPSNAPACLPPLPPPYPPPDAQARTSGCSSSRAARRGRSSPATVRTSSGRATPMAAMTQALARM
jgi:hypothetical protein